MQYDKPELSEILEAISRLAGNLVGAAVIARKKIELCAKELKAAETAQPVNSETENPGDTGAKDPAPGQEPKQRPELESELEALRQENKNLLLSLNDIRNQIKHAIGRQEELKLRAAALQSDLNTAKEQLAQKTSRAQKVRLEHELQLKVLADENKTLISDLQKARQEAQQAKSRQHTALRAKMAQLESHFAAMRRDLQNAGAKEQDTDSQVPPDIGAEPEGQTVSLPESAQEKAAQKTELLAEEDISDKGRQAKVDTEQQQKPAAAAEQYLPADITAEELHAAVFTEPPDRAIFTKALSELASGDAAVRTNAVRAIGKVRHKLSVRVLAANAEQESSPSVRQECIKALTNLEMTESLPAIKNALADPAASVRLAAVWGLYRLAGIEAVSALAEMFLDDNEEVRRRAVNCITWLGKTEKTLEAAGKPQIWKVISGLIGRLQDPADSVRKAALDALETITGEKVSTALPIDENTQKNLISRWHKWWKDKLLG